MATSPDVQTGVTWLLALSGWIKVLYDWTTSRPKIRGRLIFCLRGLASVPASFQGQMASYYMYAYLINKRKSGVHILEYELEAKIQHKWTRLKRAYRAHLLGVTDFPMADGETIRIPGIADDFITDKRAPVEFGKPVHGWLVFFGDESQAAEPIEHYRLTCVDAYGRRHRFTSKASKFESSLLIAELAKVEFPALLSRSALDVVGQK